MDIHELEIVGRRAEIEQMATVLEGVGAGAARCVAVIGEPGIGKTRLLLELRRMAEALGHPVLRGAAAEFERDVPFALWADALDAYVASLEALPPEVDGPDGPSALAAVLPSRGGAEAQPLADERYRTHRAMRRLLEALAADRPIVVILDDLHWADRASLELLTALLRREPAAPVLLALGCRRGKVPETLRAGLAQPIVQLVELAPLEEADTLALAGGELEPAERRALLRESGGNPFYTLQLARRPAGRPRANPRGGSAGDSGVPPAVAAALSEELGALSAPALALLQAGAIAGDPHEPDVAFQIGGLADADGFEALDELLDAELLRSTDSPRLFAFRHPLVRRAVYEGIKGGSRIEAHGRAARALAAAGAAPLARAHHVELSATAGDADAIELLRQAGEASARTSPAGAARWFAAVAQLVGHGDSRVRLDALVRLAEALRSAGEAARCRDVLLDALDLVPAQETGLENELTAACAGCEDFLGEHDIARARLERALEHLPEGSPHEAIGILLNLAAGAWFTLDFERMRDTAIRCRDAARPLDDPGLLAAALAALTLAEVMLADTDAALGHATQAAELFDRLDDLAYAQRLEAVNHLGWAEYYLERFEAAIAHLTRGVAVARATGRGTFISFMEECHSLAAMAVGQPDAAHALREDMVDGARLAGFGYGTATALAISAAGGLMAGDLEAARREADEALGLLQGAGGTVAGFAGAASLIASIEADHAVRVGEPLLAAAGGWELSGLPPSWGAFFHGRLTDALLGAREPERAAASAAAAHAAAGRLGLPRTMAMALHAQAAVLLHRGELDEAAAVALRAHELASAAGGRLDSARAQRLAGKALAPSDRARAIVLLREAELELELCGARRDRDDARRALRKLGVRSEPRGRATAKDAGVGSLSSREREIADLVTSRKTNREMAADLFLSEKTIESHLRNIFVKLGASSRVDVARMIEAHTD